MQHVDVFRLLQTFKKSFEHCGEMLIHRPFAILPHCSYVNGALFLHDLGILDHVEAVPRDGLALDCDCLCRQRR